MLAWDASATGHDLTCCTPIQPLLLQLLPLPPYEASERKSPSYFLWSPSAPERSKFFNHFHQILCNSTEKTHIKNPKKEHSTLTFTKCFQICCLLKLAHLISYNWLSEQRTREDRWHTQGHQQVTGQDCLKSNLVSMECFPPATAISVVPLGLIYLFTGCPCWSSLPTSTLICLLEKYLLLSMWEPSGRVSGATHGSWGRPVAARSDSDFSLFQSPCSQLLTGLPGVWTVGFSLHNSECWVAGYKVGREEWFQFSDYNQIRPWIHFCC